MKCITCNEREATLDDNCLECEKAFYLSDPAEAEFLVEMFNKRPEFLADWKPVIDVLMRMH